MMLICLHLIFHDDGKQNVEVNVKRLCLQSTFVFLSSSIMLNLNFLSVLCVYMVVLIDF